MKALKRNILKGAFWVGVERFGQQGIQFIVSIILARLLEPSEFGLIAMIAVFTGVATRISFGGFGGALVQRSNVTETDINTVFWFNLCTGVLLTVIVFFCAPLIASFYDQPRLTAITRWSSLSILGSSLELTHSIILNKELLYKKRSIFTIAGILISGTVSVSMAFGGFGVWALVAQMLTMHVVLIVLYWSTARWKVQFVFDWTAFREMFHFGHNLMLSVVARAFFENIHSVLIGKFYSATDVGFFQRGKRFSDLLSKTPAMMLSQLSFPMMSRVQNNRAEMLYVFRNIYQLGMMLILPALIGTAVVAKNLIVVLVGEKWLPSVPYLQILCITGIFYVVLRLNSDVFKALGKGREFLHCEMILHFITTISVILLLRYGIRALLIGDAVATFVAALYICQRVSKQLGSNLFAQLKWVLKSVVASGIMGFFLWFIASDSLTFWSLILKVLLGVVSYLGMLIIMKDEMLLVGWNRTKSFLSTLVC